MLKLSEPELRELGIHGYVVVRDVIPSAILAAASRAIERLVDEQPHLKVMWGVPVPLNNYIWPHITILNMFICLFNFRNFKS